MKVDEMMIGPDSKSLGPLGGWGGKLRQTAEIPLWGTERHGVTSLPIPTRRLDKFISLSITERL
jgi:hypothetical protein